jgi:hypothetical protein
MKSIEKQEKKKLSKGKKRKKEKKKGKESCYYRLMRYFLFSMNIQ